MGDLGTNRVEKLLEEIGSPPLPTPGFEIEADRTAVVITDPQNDFLHPDGVAWGACGESVEENQTNPNLKALMETAQSTGMQLIISPHY